MQVALFALASLVATQATGTAKPVPMAVQVEAAKDAQGVDDWVRELRAALAARKDEFRLVKPGEKPELVVRLDSVARGAEGAASLRGALVLGEVSRPFTYSFNDVQVEAEKLARNLRKLADQMKGAATTP